MLVPVQTNVNKIAKESSHSIIQHCRRRNKNCQFWNVHGTYKKQNSNEMPCYCFILRYFTYIITSTHNNHDRYQYKYRYKYRYYKYPYRYRYKKQRESKLVPNLNVSTLSNSKIGPHSITKLHKFGFPSKFTLIFIPLSIQCSYTN